MINEYRIGDRIRYFRKKAGITQKELADLVGLNESTIRNYELGNREPGLDRLAAIAEALKVSIYALSIPNINEINGMLHVLFEMEDLYQLTPDMIDGEIVLRFDTKRLKKLYGKNPFGPHFPKIRKKSRQELEELLQKFPSPSATLILELQFRNWFYARKDYMDGAISQEAYEDWKMKYPAFSGFDLRGRTVFFDENRTAVELDLPAELFEDWEREENWEREEDEEEDEE